MRSNEFVYVSGRCAVLVVDVVLVAGVWCWWQVFVVLVAGVCGVGGRCVWCWWQVCGVGGRRMVLNGCIYKPIVFINYMSTIVSHYNL